MQPKDLTAIENGVFMLTVIWQSLRGITSIVPLPAAKGMRMTLVVPL
jgi:hypothetical protein